MLTQFSCAIRAGALKLSNRTIKSGGQFSSSSYYHCGCFTAHDKSGLFYFMAPWCLSLHHLIVTLSECTSFSTCARPWWCESPDEITLFSCFKIQDRLISLYLFTTQLHYDFLAIFVNNSSMLKVEGSYLSLYCPEHVCLCWHDPLCVSFDFFYYAATSHLTIWKGEHVIGNQSHSQYALYE